MAFGGTLVQHLPDVDGLAEHRNEAKQAMHGVGSTRQPPGRGAGQVEAEALPHHQSLDRLGDGFRPVAWAPDGLVEGIERDQGWTVGVLWHRSTAQPTRSSTGCCGPSWRWRPGVDRRFGGDAPSR